MYFKLTFSGSIHAQGNLIGLSKVCATSRATHRREQKLSILLITWYNLLFKNTTRRADKRRYLQIVNLNLGKPSREKTRK